MNSKEIKVLHGLECFDPVFLHEYLDIALLVCIDAVRAYRGIHDNFKDQIAVDPSRADKLNSEAVKVEQKIVASLIHQSQIHGMTEKESEKSLAIPDYPYHSSISRGPVREIFTKSNS